MKFLLTIILLLPATALANHITLLNTKHDTTFFTINNVECIQKNNNLSCNWKKFNLQNTKSTYQVINL